MRAGLSLCRTRRRRCGDTAATIKRAIRAYATSYNCPATVLRNLSELYKRKRRTDGAEPFAGVFLAFAGADRRKLTYVSAGCETALLVHRNGFSELLPATGPVAERSIALSPDSTVLAVSDGIARARCGGKSFGLARVRQIVSERANGTLDALAFGIMDRASAFCHGNMLDDMAVLAVRFGSEG